MDTNIKFNFRCLTQDDLPLLFAWFQEPHVHQWWPEPSANEFHEKFLKKIQSQDTVPYLVLLNEIPIGYIQYYFIDPHAKKAYAELSALPKTTVSTDQFIGDPNFIGKGYGTLMIKAFIDYLTTDLLPETTTIIVDPDPKNIIAIRCYEKVGFKRMGIFERTGGPALIMRYDVN